ncbi:sigma 54-interacting transcriptional regulator, partial [Desulfobacterales bacterium HSG17]|nr:sigma 54-interacting transcriptional regulator [Desulfobacterales bacterium HSG17]
MTTDNTEKRLLVIDDEENMRHMLTTLLGKFGYNVDTASDGYQALEKVSKSHYDFILCDLKMPNMGGMEFLGSAKKHLVASTVIVMSAYGSIDTAVEAMKMGAYDYISKPFKTDEVYLSLKKAEERETLRKENLQLKERIKTIEQNYSFANMIGKSHAMQSTFKLALKAAQYNTTVLISGESGTGKELIAKGIHFNGERQNKIFIPVNCGGIPDNLLESEFFGYKKGSFTGADKNTKGLFEEANGGTLFLDEIGELPANLQVKFLRVLQENEVRPIGESKPRKIDVRILAATSKNLEEEAKKGHFRQDLFYRLNVLPIKLPPLRDRSEDIPLLCNYFIDKYKKTLSKKILDENYLTPDDIKMFIPHQANLRIIDSVSKKIGLKPEQGFVNIGKYGNTTAATIPLAMSEAYQDKSIKKDDWILLSAFGAGFTWGSLL